MRFSSLHVALATVLVFVGGCTGVPLKSGQTNVVELVRARSDTQTASSVESRAAAIDTTASAVPADAEQRVRERLREPLQVSTAVQIALLRNPTLQVQLATLGISAADVFEANRLANPGLSLAVLLPQGNATGNRVSAGATLGLSDLLLRRARKDIAASEYQRTQELVAGATLGLAVDVQLAWFDVVSATQRAAVRQSVEETAQSAADLAKRYLDAGNIGQLAFQLQAAAASEARIASQRVTSELAEARARLQSLLGLSAAESSWTVPQPMPATLIADTDTAALRSQALTQRLDLAAARSHVSALERQLASTRRYRYLGTSDIGVAGEREADKTLRIGPSLSLALPVFNQGQGKVARAAAELSGARAAQQKLETQIVTDVQLQSDRMRLAREQAATYRDGLIPQREAVVARLQEQVNFMLTDSFNLLIAKQQEYAAYEGYIEAVHSFWSARVELMRAVGATLPEEAKP